MDIDECVDMVAGCVAPGDGGSAWGDVTPQLLDQLNPDELRTLKEVPYPDAERSGWSLLDAVTSKIPIAKLASITAHAAGQSESFSQSELLDKSLQLIVRHNKRGELRLKVYRAGKESDEGLRALQKVVVTPLSSLEK